MISLVTAAAPVAAQVGVPPATEPTPRGADEAPSPVGGAPLTPPDADATPGDANRGPSWLVAVALASTAAVAGATAGTAVTRRSSARSAASPEDGPPPETAPDRAMDLPAGALAGPSAAITHVATSTPPADREREVLVRALIDVGDLVTSAAVRGQITHRLADVGVETLGADVGEPFDPDRHRGVQSTPAPARELDGTVAECDRTGWTDRGRVLRPPEVVVHRWEPGS